MIDKWGMLIAEMHRSDERKHISCYILSPMLNLTLGFYLKFQTKDNMLPLAGKICRQLEFMVIIFSISFHTVESCSTISKLHKWSWKFRIYSIILHKWGGGLEEVEEKFQVWPKLWIRFLVEILWEIWKDIINKRWENAYISVIHYYNSKIFHTVF